MRDYTIKALKDDSNRLLAGRSGVVYLCELFQSHTFSKKERSFYDHEPPGPSGRHLVGSLDRFERVTKSTPSEDRFGTEPGSGVKLLP